MGKVVAVIPARAGSKGVVDKNVRPLAGRPLLAFSIRAALLTPGIDRVIVSTDSQRYADIAREYGAEIPFLRPASLADDHSTDFDFFDHLAGWMKNEEGEVPDLFVHLRPTTPFRDPSLIGPAINALENNPDATALRSVQEMPESAYKSFEVSSGILKRVGSGSTELDIANNARQTFPKTYYANGYVDVIRSSLILKRRLLHGDRVLAYETPVVTEVDTQDDLDYLHFEAERYPEVITRLF